MNTWFLTFVGLIVSPAFLSAQAGTLDKTFNDTGMVTIPVGSANAIAQALAVQPDGKIVLAGFASNGSNNDFGLTRFNTDGSPDLEFNETGNQLIDFNGTDDFAEGIAVRPENGKIIIGGYTFNGSGFDFALAQYLPDGSPDSFFGTNGRTTTPVGTNVFATALGLQHDGRIVMAGYSTQSGNNEFTLGRWLEDGSPDPSLDEDGIVTTHIGISNSAAFCLLIQPDGKIIVAGQAFNDATLRWEAAIVRYLEDGTLDQQFGEDGISILTLSNKDLFITAISLDVNKNIVAAGYTGTSPSNNNFVLLRFLPDGRPDSLFDEDGLLVAPFNGNNNEATSVLTQPDGKIVIAGHAEINGTDHFALARYDQHGLLDPTFGTAGKTTTRIGDFNGLNSLTLAGDGKILAAGGAFIGTHFEYTICRYHNDLETSTADMSIPGIGVSVYPNPVTESFTLNYTLEQNDELTIRLIDLQGRVITTFGNKIKTAAGLHAQQFSIPSMLTPGKYILHITSITDQATLPIACIRN